MKGTARKVRKVYQGKVLVGFAGGTADAFTLLDRFEGKLEKHLILSQGAHNQFGDLPSTARIEMLMQQ